jgi:hypothetical protein
MSLIEVVAALTILALAALAWIGLARQGMHTLTLAQRHERQLRDASTLLVRFSLFTREDMQARLGWSGLAGSRTQVQQVAPELFAVSVLDSASGAVLLSTTYYTRDTSAAAIH